jgi:hypothetical protein
LVSLCAYVPLDRYQNLELFSLPQHGCIDRVLSLPLSGCIDKALSLPQSGCIDRVLSLPLSGYLEIPVQHGYSYFDLFASQIKITKVESPNDAKIDGFNLGRPIRNLHGCQSDYFKTSYLNFVFIKLTKIGVPIKVMLNKNFIKISYNNIKQGPFKMQHLLRSDLQSFQCIYNIYVALLCQRTQDVQLKCKILQLYIHCSLYLRHDFHAKRIRTCQRNELEVIIIFFRIFSFLTHLRRYANNQDHLLKINKATSSNIGGGRLPLFDGEELVSYSYIGIPELNVKYKFERYILHNDAQSYTIVDNSVICSLPLNLLLSKLTMNQIKDVATSHKLHIPARISIVDAQDLLKHHTCKDCGTFISVFKRHTTKSNTDIKQNQYHKLGLHQKSKILLKRAEYQSNSNYHEEHRKANQRHYKKKKETVFPPSPPSTTLKHKIIRDFCTNTSPNIFIESGCGVCGKLTPWDNLSELSNVKNINLLQRKGVS